MNEMLSYSSKSYHASFFAVFHLLAKMCISLIKKCTSLIRKFAALIKKYDALMKQWKQNYRTRRQLAELPTYLYKDVGLKKSEAQKELHKPFWR